MTSSPRSVSNSLSGKKALVTGAAGFIGSHLTRNLVDSGCETIALLRPTSDLWRIKDIAGHIETVHGDISHLDQEKLLAQLSGIDYVIHLGAAGIDQVADITSVVETNVMGTLGMLQLARSLDVERFVYCGSAFEYGDGSMITEDSLPTDPISEYAASKSGGYLLANTFHGRYGLPVTTVRPFQVYGPTESPNRLVPTTIARSLAGADIELSGGEQTRDFVYVEDVADAIVAACTSTEAVGRTFNVCRGEEVSIKDAVSTIVELCGGKATPLFGALPYRDTEIWALSGDPSQAKEALGWTSKTSLKDGLIQTIAWQKAALRQPSAVPDLTANQN
jgi:nucleoside-diphosphate-sugar epimerase